MILEMVEVTVKEGTHKQFEDTFDEAMAIFERAKGCISARLMRVIEDPNRYRLFVHWETLESHTEDFRNSPDYERFRSLARPYVERAVPPEHHSVVHPGFTKPER